MEWDIKWVQLMLSRLLPLKLRQSTQVEYAKMHNATHDCCACVDTLYMGYV